MRNARLAPDTGLLNMTSGHVPPQLPIQTGLAFDWQNKQLAAASAMSPRTQPVGKRVWLAPTGLCGICHVGFFLSSGSIATKMQTVCGKEVRYTAMHLLRIMRYTSSLVDVFSVHVSSLTAQVCCSLNVFHMVTDAVAVGTC